MAALETQEYIDILNENDDVCERLSLSENDPIFSCDYRTMITEAFQHGKHFFLAKIQTRSHMDGVEMSRSGRNEDTRKLESVHSHWFNAYGILRMLF